MRRKRYLCELPWLAAGAAAQRKLDMLIASNKALTAQLEEAKTIVAQAQKDAEERNRSQWMHRHDGITHAYVRDCGA